MKNILEQIAQKPTEDIDCLIALIRKIRPRSPKKVEYAISQIENLIALLHIYPPLRESLLKYWTEICRSRSSLRLLTDLGIFSNLGFFTETNKKLVQKFLPEIHPENTFIYLLDQVFYKKNDYQWVNSVPDDVWIRLLKVLEIRPICSLQRDEIILEQILNALLIISLRMTTIGIDPEIVDRLPELEKFGSPFLAQNIEVDDFIKFFKDDPKFDRSIHNTDYKQILVILSQCESYIDIIRKNRNQYGITLNITYILLRLSQNIKRMKLLLVLLLEDKAAPAYQNEVSLLKEIVKLNNKKNSVTEHIANNISLLAFQITEHTGKTGEHYITSTRKEYFKMLKSASWGGFIVAFLCIFKTLLYYFKFPPFGQAFMYSMNYSFGFMTIYVTGSTLATKQPAMTATTIAQSLDAKHTQDPGYADNFAKLIAKVSRSQLVAFLGNVLVVFPVAFILAWNYFLFAGTHIADPHKARILLDELHPTQSYALFHAGIAGIYLFLAGLIAGYYDNKSISHKIPQRIKAHPFLKRILPKAWVNNLAGYLEHNLGNLAGNFYFGIFLGSTGILGIILGLPIDIRHITFAAGNLGLALAGLDNEVSWRTIWVSWLGIAGIGFMNFIVSFSLSITVAIQSRRVKFKETKKLFRGLRKLIFKKPLQFVFPPRKKPMSSETNPETEIQN
ncbi:MAG: site-specific recombinase [Microscillaceae bacterium]|nr:site-specific recombinase [Microscillaceae bacterium]